MLGAVTLFSPISGCRPFLTVPTFSMNALMVCFTTSLEFLRMLFESDRRIAPPLPDSEIQACKEPGSTLFFYAPRGQIFFASPFKTLDLLPPPQELFSLIPILAGREKVSLEIPMRPKENRRLRPDSDFTSPGFVS